VSVRLTVVVVVGVPSHGREVTVDVAF